MTVMRMMNAKATVVYVTSSLRVGQITFRSSAATCRVNRAGEVRSRLSAAPDPLRRSALWPRVWVAMSSPNALADLRRTVRPDLLVQPIRTCRAGGTRTPNRRFWRPGLYQLSYCPTVVTTRVYAERTPLVEPNQLTGKPVGGRRAGDATMEACQPREYRPGCPPSPNPRPWP